MKVKSAQLMLVLYFRSDLKSVAKSLFSRVQFISFTPFGSLAYIDLI